MNISVLFIGFTAELLGITIYSIIVYGIFGLTQEKVKNNPKKRLLRQKIRMCEHLILGLVILLLLIWCISQFIFFGATVTTTFQTIVAGILLLFWWVMAYFFSSFNCAMLIVILQVILCVAFSDISTTTVYSDDELMSKEYIEYYEHKNLPQKVSEDKIEFFDFYYYSEIDEKYRHCFSTQEYNVEVKYDIPNEKKEYYEMFSRTNIIKTDGIGIYYTSKSKPVVVIHAK